MILPALLPLLAVPQGAMAPAQDGLPGPLHVFTMGMGDLSLLVQHPKDAGLLRAMNMLDERLAELPDELGREMPPPLATAFTPESIPTWMHLLSSKKSLRYDLDPAGMQNGMPLLISVAVHEDSDESAALFESDLRGQLEAMQAPVPPGMIRRDGASLLLGNGKNPGPIGTTRAAGMLDGAPLAFEMSMDVGGYVDFFQSMLESQGAPPEAAIVFDIINRMGLDEMTVEIASSVDAEKSTTTSVVTGIGGKMREAGLLPEGGLTTAHLAPIPADAKWASVQRLDLLAGFDALNGIASEIMASQGAGGDAAEMLASTIGLDLRAGLFGALGDTYGMYASDTTGGGGMASTVLFFSLRDSEALLETKEQLEEMINGLACDADRRLRTGPHVDAR